jgi:hypothetical protein
MENKNQIISIIGFVVVIVLIIGAFAYFNQSSTKDADKLNATINSTATSTLDGFAQCVASKGLTMYGAVWCGHCINEKKAFGSAFKYISYVECPDNIKLCTDKGINGYPTWIDGAGKKYEGEQGLTGLAKITGCELPTKAL